MEDRIKRMEKILEKKEREKRKKNTIIIRVREKKEGDNRKY